jgi:hypothetical protein
MKSPDPDELGRPSGDTGRMVLVLGVTLPLATAAGIGIGMLLFGAKPAPPPPAPKCAPAPAPSAKEPETAVERATLGDFKALDELKAKPPEARSVDETLALARGRSGNKARALEGFAAELRKNSDILKDKDPLDRLREFLANRETTNQAAEVVAKLPGPLGPDLLYDAMTAVKQPNETTALAEELLASKELRDRASPALLVALDLRKAKECDAAKALLPRAAEAGDRRSIPLLIKLANKRGCGDDKRDDCWECLRDLDKDKAAIDLGDAVTAAKKRAGPKF